jgi:hypothetical protein
VSLVVRGFQHPSSSSSRAWRRFWIARIGQRAVRVTVSHREARRAQKIVRNMVNLPSEKVVPEKIETAAENETFARVAHDLLHLPAVSGAVAVHRAVLAGRFWIEGAAAAALAGIDEEVAAGAAEGAAFPLMNLLVRVSVPGAVDGDEEGQHPEVGAFLGVQGGCLVGGVYHGSFFTTGSQATH